MKKLLCVILSVFLMLGVCSLPAGAEEVLRDGDIFIEGDFECKIVNGAVSIVDYLGEHGEDVDVVVPETIRGYTVKYIGAMAFYGQLDPYAEFDEYNSISLPDCIEAIGFGAFQWTGAEINMPNNIKYIFDNAFFNAFPTLPSKEWQNTDESGEIINLFASELPSTLQYIGMSNFLRLRHLIMPENLIYINGWFLGEALGYDNQLIIAPVGSYAQGFAKRQEVPFLSNGYCVGDIDYSGVIDVADILTLKNDIMADQYRDAEISDLDKDGTVNVADIMVVKEKIMNPKTATEEWLQSVYALRDSINK